MFPCPRYHNPGRWRERWGETYPSPLRTLTRLLGAENRHPDWRDPRPHPGEQWRWVPRNEPRRFYGPPRPSQTRPQLSSRWPYCYGNQRWERDWKWEPPRAHRSDWKPHVLPRRGPPVAMIKAPRWYQQDACKRQPRGFEPRGGSIILSFSKCCQNFS